MSSEVTARLRAIEHADAALLVIDMQNAFCHPEGTLGVSGVDISDCRGVIPIIERLVRAASEAGVPVVWTIQEHFREDLWRQRKRLPNHTAKRARVSALAGTWDADLVDELATLADDPSLVVRKHRFGGFYETRLDLVLRMLGRRALIVTGVTANACVETTMREAYLRDYDVVAVLDAIGGIDPRWKTLAAEVWGQYLGVVVDSGDVLRWFGSNRDDGGVEG